MPAEGSVCAVRTHARTWIEEDARGFAVFFVSVVEQGPVLLRLGVEVCCVICSLLHLFSHDYVSFTKI
jgi:hypothetical protein